MRCEEVRALLSEYQLGGLSARRRRAVESHLAKCESCTEELAQLADLDKSIRERFRAERAPDLWPRVRSELADAPLPVAAPLRYSIIPVGAAAALALLWFFWSKPDGEHAVTMEPEVGYERHHALLGWKDPLADKVHLGLAGLETESDEGF